MNFPCPCDHCWHDIEVTSTQNGARLIIVKCCKCGLHRRHPESEEKK